MAEDNRRTQAIQALKEAAARAELSCEHVKISPEACRIIIGMLADPGWISVKDRLPEDQVTVLAVKQLKNGRRDICLARCILEYEHFDVETRTKVISPYWACGGNNNIIYWMPLPGLPEEG